MKQKTGDESRRYAAERNSIVASVPGHPPALLIINLPGLLLMQTNDETDAAMGYTQSVDSRIIILVRCK